MQKKNSPEERRAKSHQLNEVQLFQRRCSFAQTIHRKYRKTQFAIGIDSWKSGKKATAIADDIVVETVRGSCHANAVVIHLSHFERCSQHADDR